MRHDFLPEFDEFASRIFNGDAFHIVEEHHNFIHLIFDSNEDEYTFSRNDTHEDYITYRFHYIDEDGYQNELFIDFRNDEYETAQDLSVTLGFVTEDIDFDEETFQKNF